MQVRQLSLVLLAFRLGVLPAEQAAPLKLLEKGVSKEALAGLVRPPCPPCGMCCSHRGRAGQAGACRPDGCSAKGLKSASGVFAGVSPQHRLLVLHAFWDRSESHRASVCCGSHIRVGGAGAAGVPDRGGVRAGGRALGSERERGAPLHGRLQAAPRHGCHCDHAGALLGSHNSRVCVRGGLAMRGTNFSALPSCWWTGQKGYRAAPWQGPQLK